MSLLRRFSEKKGNDERHQEDVIPTGVWKRSATFTDALDGLQLDENYSND